MVPTFGISDWLSSGALSVWISGRAKRMKSATSPSSRPWRDPDLGRRRVTEDVDQAAGVPDQPDLEDRDGEDRDDGPGHDPPGRAQVLGEERPEPVGRRVRFGIGRVGVDEQLEEAEHGSKPRESGRRRSGPSGPVRADHDRAGIRTFSIKRLLRGSGGFLAQNARGLSPPGRPCRCAAPAGQSRPGGRRGPGRRGTGGDGPATVDGRGAQGARRGVVRGAARPDLRRLRGDRGRAGRRAVRRPAARPLRAQGDAAGGRGGRRRRGDGGDARGAGLREGGGQRLDGLRAARRAGAAEPDGAQGDPRARRRSAVLGERDQPRRAHALAADPGGAHEHPDVLDAARLRGSAAGPTSTR